MTRVVKLILLLLLLLFVLGGLQMVPLAEYFYITRSEVTLKNDVKTKLVSLGSKSLSSLDVPVGALLFYKDSLIGSGYNTVMRDSVAYGHAEINALTMALKKYGVNRFRDLDRNELVLYTSLEPCEMCKGAIIEYRIKHVKFMMPKNFSYWYDENKWSLLYQFHKQQTTGRDLQDSLFRLHPAYQK